MLKTILITGINGYLGSKLAKRYSQEYKVIGDEYASKKFTGRQYCEENGFEYHQIGKTKLKTT